MKFDEGGIILKIVKAFQISLISNNLWTALHEAPQVLTIILSTGSAWGHSWGTLSPGVINKETSFFRLGVSARD